jgi:hypothetical protein
MKRHILTFGLLIPSLGFAQQYSIDWFKIAGGGDTSTNVRFAVSGTIGQHDATTQTLIGGSFSVTGGFWSLFAMQTPGSPLLTIMPGGANGVISWPSPSTGFVLEENSTLDTLGWTSVTNSISDNGATRSVTVSVFPGNRFYRLKK